VAERSAGLLSAICGEIKGWKWGRQGPFLTGRKVLLSLTLIAWKSIPACNHLGGEVKFIATNQARLTTPVGNRNWY
jgi:hypothetical protein